MRTIQNKKLILPVVLLVIAVLVSYFIFFHQDPGKKSVELINWKTYIDPEGLFEIKYPGDWEKSLSSGQGIVFIDNTNKSDPYFLDFLVDLSPEIHISIYDRDEIMSDMKYYSNGNSYSEIPTLKEYTDAYTNNIKTTTHKLILESSNTSASGIDAYKLIYSETDIEETIGMFFEVMAIKNDKLYKIEMIVSEKKFSNELLKTFQKMVDSFTILDLSKEQLAFEIRSNTLSETKRSDWKTYYDEKDPLNIKIDYPSNWTYEINGDRSIIFTPGNDSGFNPNGVPFLQISSTELSEMPRLFGIPTGLEKLEEVSDAYLNLMTSSDPIKSDHLKITNVTISGTPALRVEFDDQLFDNKEIKTRSLAFMIVKNKNFYILGYMAPVDSFSDFLEFIEKIVFSIKI